MRPGSGDAARGREPERARLVRPAGRRVRTIATPRGADRPAADIVVAVAVPADADPAAVEVLRALLEDGARRARHEIGAVYTSRADLSDQPGGGALEIAATVSPDRIVEAVAMIREDLETLRAGGPPLARRFAAARRRAVERLALGASSARTASEELARAASRGWGPAELAAMARRMASMTLPELEPVAASLLRPEAQAIVLRGPAEALRAAAAAISAAAGGR
jgi:predicted Zn-dependent peptidase